MSYFKLYCILHLTSVAGFLQMAMLISAIMLPIFYIQASDDCKKLTKILYYFSFPGLFLSIALAFVPSKNTTLQMIGMHYVTNSDSLKSLPDDMVKLLEKSLQDTRKDKS